jgi:hypothetical protein
MKNPTPVSPPLTLRQLELLEAIKADKEKLRTLPPRDHETETWVPEFYEIQKRIDDLSVKALRSGVLRGRPAESRRPGFFLVFDSSGEYAKVLLGAGDFHPGLPLWAENHFVEWIQMQRLREKGRETLRKTKIPGLETGMRCPKDMTLIMMVLELRGFEEEDSAISLAVANEPPPNSLTEMLEKSKRIVTDEMLENARQSEITEKKRTRVRRERRSWDWVIKKLVEEGLLKRIITHQALKKMLKNRYPEWDWGKI